MVYRDNMKVKKVNWYDDDTKKDNTVLFIDAIQYNRFKSEIDRDKQASEQKG
jgi:hypothetical protein